MIGYTGSMITVSNDRSIKSSFGSFHKPGTFIIYLSEVGIRGLLNLGKHELTALYIIEPSKLGKLDSG